MISTVGALAPFFTVVLAVITLGTYIVKPYNSLKCKVEKLEETVKTLEEQRDSFKVALKKQTTINILELKALKTICDHHVEGNHTEQLKETSAEIMGFVLSEGGEV